jgi:hypothetical protein
MYNPAKGMSVEMTKMMQGCDIIINNYFFVLKVKLDDTFLMFRWIDFVAKIF